MSQAERFMGVALTVASVQILRYLTTVSARTAQYGSCPQLTVFVVIFSKLGVCKEEMVAIGHQSKPLEHEMLEFAGLQRLFDLVPCH